MEIKNVNGDKDENPYLSIVICSRNDNHGGNMLQRMQVSISGLLEQLEKHRIESELILVDWNPPADKPLLKGTIQWPSGLTYCTIRVIEVPSRIHRRYKYHKKVHMHNAVAVNTGFRRARGKFVLLGLIDLLYPDELMSFIASKSLKTSEVYRADRCNVDRNVVRFNTLREQLNFCRQNVIKVYTKISWVSAGLPDLHVAGGDFQLMSRENFHLLHGYREAEIASGSCDTILTYASYAAGVREVVLKEPLRVYHIDHDEKFVDRIKASDVPFVKWVSLPFIPRPISFRLISLYRKYVGETTKDYVFGGVPSTYGEKCLKLCRDIVNGKHSYKLNENTWGLAGENLQETIISSAKWE